MAQVVAAAPLARQYQRPTRWALARQAVMSFVVVLICYWVYGFVAVPLIEPSDAERMAQAASSEQRVAAARDTVTVRQRELAQYFGPDDWEAKDPAIWQSGQMRLLFGKLEPQPDGNVELNPCTLMFFPAGPSDRPARPIIMRAVEGAVIQFDERIVLRTVNLNERKFRGGELRGEIRIVQKESEPGAGDDLEITTRGIKMSSDRAWTPEPVHFRLGRSYGSGRDLEIQLASSDPTAPAGEMRSMSVRMLELKRDVRMRLVTDDGPLAADGTTGNPRAGGEPPIEITCDASFEFDMQDYAASFRQNVNVFRLNPVGESDQLNCQLLTVYFARPGEPAPAASGEGPRSAASQVRLIEARGNPVTMRSPAQAMYARCNGVDYTPAAAGQPGTLLAYGPGVIHGNLPNDPAGKYTGSWARELRFEPEGPLYRATLRGATKIDIGQMGQITADEVFAWLSQQPKPVAPAVAQRGATQPVAHQPGHPAENQAWQIERVAARRYPAADAAQSQGAVVVESPQLRAEADSLEAIVVRTAAVAAENAPGGPAGGAPPSRQPQPPAAQNPAERFEVTGRSVQIQLVPRGEELAVATATIEQAAELTQWSIEGELRRRQLLVKGDRLHVTEAHTDATRVTIAGQPGFVEAQGMSLWGGAIELEKSSDRLWIEGPGRLLLPVTQDMDGQPLARPQQLTVDWKQRMNFQRDTAVFNGSVVARSAQQVVNTETLEARLSRPVKFSNPNLGPSAGTDRLDLAGLRTRGLTFLEGRQLDEQGQQTSFSQMQVNDLAIDRTSGAISGLGPGWVKHVSLGAPAPVELPGQKPAAATPADENDKLTYLHVNFRQGLSGNLNQRQVKFFDQTKTLYGPVSDWGQQLVDHDLAGLGATGMSLEADSLDVREMPGGGRGKRGTFELDASGGIFAEGQRFTAQGDRLTYAEQNDQLALHGDPAELYRENPNDGTRSEFRAKLVQYWFKDHRVWVNGANALTLPLGPAPQAKPRANAPAMSTGAPPTAGPAMNPLPPPGATFPR